MRPIKDVLRHSTQFFQGVHPARFVFLGYLSYVLVGWGLLCLPFAQKTPGVPALDNLFISASAVSTTGLATVSVGDSYTLLGQCIVLLLIQLGGIGYMTFSSFVVLSKKSPLSGFRTEIGKAVFSLPDSFRVDKFIRSVIEFTLIIESVGTFLLYIIFREESVANPLWCAIFHSVSAFCTAGFSLFNTSFEGFTDHFWLNLVIAVLSYLGAVGFIVFVDCWRRFRGKVQSITLTSKIILWATVWLSITGTILLFLGEPSLQSMPVDKRLLAAFFQSMTAMTTVGFNTISVGQLSKASLLLVVVLMVIGASPSGTGGGLKSTTFTAILGVMRSAIRGENEVRFWNRVVPLERVWTAVASLGFYLLALVIGTYLLELTENSPFEANFFESASALGTVGLSMGITASLTNIGKLTVTLMMFCGRLGPLTFGIALFLGGTGKNETQDSDLAV